MSLGDLLALQSNAWRPAADLERLQARKLRALLAHAYRHVPFHRRRFMEAGVRPEDIRTPRDLARLPLTTRQDLTSRPVEDITADNVNLSRCVQARTSGSLGMPLTVYFRQRDRFLQDLVWARARLANGQRLGDRVVTLREPGRAEPPHWFQRIGIWRKVTLSCLDDADTALLDRLLRLRPDVLVGYPSALRLLSRIMDREQRRLRPRLVFTSSELLTDTDRRVIERAFGVPVCDCYGAHETGLIAWQCPEHGRYHINSDGVLVEWEWDGKPALPGQRARLICTVFSSFAMPFIRYVIGDVGIACPEPCPCGRGLPVMKVVEGREADFVILPDGRWLSPDALCGIIGAIPGVHQFQVVQDSIRSVSVRLQSPAETGSRVAAELADVLGPDVELGIACSATPVWSGSGKCRTVVSKVAARE